MPAESAPARPPWQRKTLHVAECGVLLLFVIGLAVRLTIRDRILVANTIYYATPWSILFVLGALSAWRMAKKGQRPDLTWGLVLAVFACGGMWMATTWSFRPATGAPKGVRVLTWNLGHGRWGLPALAGEAARLQPDIAVFVEADPSQTDIRGVFQAAFPDQHVFLLGGGIVLVSRWPGGEARAYQLGTQRIESRIREVDLETPWGTWTVFGCDIASNILYQREPHLRALAERVAKCANPVIVAGDFNTPLDSIHMCHLRRIPLQEAFEASGAGYLATWPLPAPVLSLDQIWVSRTLAPENCIRSWYWRSDHAAVIATIDPGPAVRPGR